MLSYTHCQMLSHNQESLCIVTSPIQLIVQWWSVVSRFGLCTTDPYGIQSVDLEVRRLLNPSYCSATLCEKLLSVSIALWFLCSSHICSDLLSIFDNFIRYPCFQSVSGTCSFSLFFLNRTWSVFAVACVSVFNASTGILSGPTTSPLLICLMTILIFWSLVEWHI